MSRGRRRQPFGGGSTGGGTTTTTTPTTTGTTTGTFSNLIQAGQFTQTRGTVELRSSDVPTEIGSMPIPFPWQGLQRAAVVFNLNFVWDDAEKEWIRDEGNGGAGGGQGVIDSGTFDVPDSSGQPNLPFFTNVTSLTEGAYGTIGFADQSDLAAGQVNFALSSESGSSGDTLVWKLGFDPSTPGYFFDINHEFGNDVTVRWAIIQPDF